MEALACRIASGIGGSGVEMGVWHGEQPLLLPEGGLLVVRPRAAMDVEPVAIRGDGEVPPGS